MRRSTRITLSISVALLMVCLLWIAGHTTPVLRPASSENPLTLPQDEGAHSGVAIEWWYYTGHLQTEDGAKYGFELVFFEAYPSDNIKIGPIPLKWLVNPAYLAQFAITDESMEVFAYDERMNIPRIWAAGADEDRYRVWNNGWQAEGTGGEHHLQTSMEDYAIDLHLSSTKPPVFHGQQGIVDMGRGGGSYYYSYTRIQVEGTLTIAGTAKQVEGIAWMDHQWGSWDRSGYQGWDWFSLQLDDGSELMLFDFRDAEGAIQTESSGTVVYPDGRAEHLSSSDFQARSLDEWLSPHSGAVYPVNWHVVVPARGIDLQVRPTGLDRELHTAHAAYWEGPVAVEGQSGGQPVEGVGYVELTGYGRR